MSSSKFLSRKKLIPLTLALCLSLLKVITVFSAQDSHKPPVWVGIYTTAGKVGLKWVPVPGALRYKVYRSIASGKNYQLLATTTDISFIDSSVRPGETYYYVLKTVGGDKKESGYSDERYIRIPVSGAGVPVKPPEWVGALVEEKMIKLAWNPSASSNVLAYNVYRSREPQKGFQLIGSTQDTSLTDTDVKEGETYYYALSALDKDFKETKMGEVKKVHFAMPKEQPSAGGEVPGAPGARPGKRPGAPPPALPEKLAAKPTRPIHFILKGKDEKPLFSPTDVALGPDENIYISDTGHSMVQVFNKNGKFIRAVGGYGTKEGKFEKLLGVDVDRDGDILAVDAYTGRIQKFDKNGRLIMYKKMLEDGKEIAIDLGLKDPVKVFGIIKGIYSPDGRLYFIDNFNDCIEIYSATGKYIKTFGGKGRQEGKFLSPTFAVFGKDGHLYITDCLNARVQVFDKDGRFLWTFGGYGNVVGTFGRPKGIDIDDTGKIYVADSMTNVIQVFDDKGRFLYLLGDERGKQMDLATPNGIAVDKNDRIYMVEKLVNRIQIRQVREK